jgi:hypothetical protein
VSGVDGASWNNKELDFVSDCAKGFQYFLANKSSHAIDHCSHLSNGISFTVHVKKVIELDHREESSNIFRNNPSGLCFGNNSEHLIPEVAVVFLASSLPGLGKWLAWKPSCKQSCAPVSGSVEGSNISVDSRTASLMVNVRYGLILFGFCPCRSPALASGVGHSPEVLFEDRLRIGFYLHEAYRLESRPLCGEGEAADA